MTKHAVLMPCRECARLKLRAKIAKTPKEAAQWLKLLDRHLARTGAEIPVPYRED